MQQMTAGTSEANPEDASEAPAEQTAQNMENKDIAAAMTAANADARKKLLMDCARSETFRPSIGPGRAAQRVGLSRSRQGRG